MKVILLGLLVVVIAMTVESYPRELFPEATGKRGFRMGAGDRFSHGFGKRLAPMDLDENFMVDTEGGLRLDIMVDHLINNPELLRAVLQRYFDRNSDGIIDRKELFNVHDD